jgi:hypothetical protein
MLSHPKLRATTENLTLYVATYTVAQQAEYDKWKNFMDGGNFAKEFGANSTNCFNKMFLRFNRKNIMLTDQLAAAADDEESI